jgi:hypothetical protein
MDPIENDVFRMVSLRGAGNGLTVDPVQNGEDSDVILLLKQNPADPQNPPPSLLEQLAALPVMGERELKALSIAPLAERIGSRTTAEQLLEMRDRADAPRDVESVRSAESRLVDSWLVGTLTKADFPRQHHERLIRVARLWTQVLRHPETLRESGAVQKMLEAKIVFPRSLRTPTRPVTDQPPASDRAAQVKAERERFKKLRADIDLIESLQRTAQRTFGEWQSVTNAAPPPATAPRRTGGIFQRVGDALFGRVVVPAAAATALAARPLDDSFFTRLDQQLSSAQRQRLGQLLGGLPPNRRPDSIGGLIDGVLSTGDLITGANDACSRIRTFETEAREQLPPPRPFTPDAKRPAVRAIGWGDLIVARERLVGYDAKEIAHIENILSGEDKLREHERTLTTQDVTETETTNRTESERDLQTTDRNELQNQASSTIQESFSVKAGVNTSGRYGLTSVDTSLDVGFQRSTSEAHSSTVTLAKEIVAKTVEKVFEQVRELRRRTVTDQIRELNRHALTNLGAAGVTPAPISGVYRWVEKIQEVALRHYGTRLMVEFHIPEPGVSLFSATGRAKTKRPKPAPFDISPAQVVAANYLCYAKAFGARDIEPPPALFVDVGFTWASAPDESADDDEAEDTLSDSIALPDGYFPLSGKANITALPYRDPARVNLYVAVGGKEVIDRAAYSADAAWSFDLSVAWPNGVPVSLLAHGHFDKALVLQVTLRCQRTPEAFTRWQLQTWQKIREAHELLVQDYERSVLEAEAEGAALFAITGRSAEVNRVMERDELKKWAIKTMRVSSFDDSLVDAIVQVGEHPEIDPIAADAQAPIVRFFEEAFEWRESSYFLYPYFWGRREAWNARLALDGVDSTHDLFLRAGAARMIVPVTPGYEERVLHYLDSDPATPELERIARPAPGEIPPNSDAEDLWVDLMIDKNAELARGSGTLSVTNGSDAVQINADSQWDATARDLGREVYIDGTGYQVREVAAAREIILDRSYEGATDSSAVYTTGSVPFGAPWLVRVPTNLVILNENLSMLTVPS